MKLFDHTFLIRFALILVMITHGITSFVNGSVPAFGKAMEPIFGFMGLPLAIAVKLIHVATIPALLFNRHLKCLALLNIIILIAGIILVHGRNGWYVVGGGTNGVEYNILLIFCFLSFIFPNGLADADKNE